MNKISIEKKKLLVTASTLPRWEGDTENRFVLDLARYMNEDFEVTILVPASPGAKSKEILEGVNVIRYHYFPIHKWETLCYPGAIVSRIKEKKIRIFLVPFLFLSLWLHLYKLLPYYDVVHAHWLLPQGIVQSFFNKPYIVTGHGGDVTSFNGDLIRKLKVKCLRKASHVIVVSEYLKKEIQKIVPDINASVISMGVDIEKFGKCYRVTNYFGQGNKKVVLFVGRLAEKKGITYLIEAMKHIDAMLVIVGDGTLRNELAQQAKKINVSAGTEKIKFLGAKTHAELKEIYASADVFAAPSITANDGDVEGLGLVMVEAMASGLPVVASNSGGISCLIQNNYNGLLCAEKDSIELSKKLEQLLYDDKLRKTIVDNGYKTVKQYDYSSIEKRIAILIKNIFI